MPARKSVSAPARASFASFWTTPIGRSLLPPQRKRRSMGSQPADAATQLETSGPFPEPHQEEGAAAARQILPAALRAARQRARSVPAGSQRSAAPAESQPATAPAAMQPAIAHAEGSGPGGPAAEAPDEADGEGMAADADTDTWADNQGPDSRFGGFAGDIGAPHEDSPTDSAPETVPGEPTECPLQLRAKDKFVAHVVSDSDSVEIPAKQEDASSDDAEVAAAVKESEENYEAYMQKKRFEIQTLEAAMQRSKESFKNHMGRSPSPPRAPCARGVASDSGGIPTNNEVHRGSNLELAPLPVIIIFLPMIKA